MGTLALVAIFIAAIWKIVDAIKLQFPKLPAIAVQALAWALGVAAAFVLRETQFASAIAAGDTFKLDQLNSWTTLIFGFSLGSATSATVDAVKAIDNTRTSSPGGVVVSNETNGEVSGLS